MQKLPFKGFSFTDIALDEVLDTDDDTDYGYWVICDLEYRNECIDKATNFHYYLLREHWRIMSSVKTKTSGLFKIEKLILDQNKKT